MFVIFVNYHTYPVSEGVAGFTLQYLGTQLIDAKARLAKSGHDKAEK